MAERKSVNKYYPPDWDPSKGSVNNYVGQHPLRDRARKLSQGILIIRFEMPYNIWCGGCNNHIGMGVRYNAEKTKTGMYYTTPIYKFRMKCHLCPNHFEIQTDPKNHDYVILEGARRKEQRWDPKENEQIVPEDRATHKKMASDAMFKLEHGSDDLKKGKAIVMTLSNLEGRRDEWKDDYVLNKIARQKFREEKKTLKSAADSDAALLSKSSLDIPLVTEREQDKKMAHLMKYRTVQSFDEKQAQKRKEIESRPIFRPSKVRKLDVSSSSSSKTSDNKKLGIIKKHLQNMENKRTCPFDSSRLKSSPKSTLDKVSLGIKRKSTGSVSHETAKEVNSEEMVTSTETDAITHPVIDHSVTETPEDRIDRNDSDSSENDRTSASESSEGDASYLQSNVARIEDLENDSKCLNVQVPVKDEMVKLEEMVNQSYQDLKHQIAKEIKEYSGDFKSICKDDFAEFPETDLSCVKEKLIGITKDTDETVNENYCESKHTCDSKHFSMATKSENCETVCDMKPKNDMEDVATKAKTEIDKESENIINIDRKSLSLIASYSDSDSDNSDSL